METQIQIKCKKEEKERIVEAGKKIGLGHSSFARMSALKEANKILEVSKTA